MTTPTPDASNPEESIQRRRLLDYSIIAVFGLMLAFVVPEHEPWTDEAQAWLLARDASLSDLLTVRLRYEGTPGLWHLLLAIPAKLGLPYFTLNLLGALCAWTGVLLLVRYSPFPLWLRALLPFTYFLGYQYAVVARSYCLLGALLFGLAIAARTREARYWPFAILLLLLSHVSLHATLLAGAIWLFEVGQGVVAWRAGESDRWRRRVAPLSLLSASFVLIIVQLVPPGDLLLREPFSFNIALKLMQLVTAEIGVAWFPASLVLLLALLPLLRAARVLGVVLTGTTFVYALICFRYFALWHVGVIFVFLIFGVWLALDCLPPPSAARPGFAFARPLALGALTVIAVFQMRGTFAAAWHDYEMPYSSSLEAAEYLRKKGIDRKKIHALDVHSFAVLPYFERNFFANFQHPDGGSYWIWNLESGEKREPLRVLSGSPEYVLVTEKWGGRLDFDTPARARGYILEKTFQGNILWRSGSIETDSLSLFRRGDVPE